MKKISFCSGFLLRCVLCALVVFGCVARDMSIAVPELQAEAVPEDIEQQKKPESSVLLEMDKYAFSNLSPLERHQVSQELLGENDITANQLVYDFRIKQENIRLYEVILLAMMSLGALAIVLKYMKDSKACHARDMLNGTGLVLVIFSTVLVIIIADVEIQLTAAMGVLGGIAGYLFGTLRSSLPPSASKKTTEPVTGQENKGDTSSKEQSH